MIEVFKIVHGYYDPKGVPFLQPSSYCNTRGDNKKLFKLRYHLDLLKYCFTVRVVSKQNSLPADVVSAPSVDMPSKTVQTSSSRHKKFVSIIKPNWGFDLRKPSLIYEPSSVVMFVICIIQVYRLHSLRPYLLCLRLVYLFRTLKDTLLTAPTVVTAVPQK